MTRELTEFENRVFTALGQTSGVADPEAWLVEAFNGGQRSQSGEVVNASNALGYPPVWFSVAKIAGHCGDLSMVLKKRTGDIISDVESSAAMRVLEITPNELQSPYDFRETITLHALLYGNGRAYIERNSLCQPTRLLPINPNNVYSEIVDGAMWHVIYIQQRNDPMSLLTGGQGMRVVVPDDDVFHLAGMSFDGYTGMSLLQIAKDALGLGLAGQSAAGFTLNNNGQPGLVINAPKHFLQQEDKAKKFKAEIDAAHSGISNAGKTMLLEDGMNATTLPSSAKDSEFVDQRQYQRDDTGLLFGLESMLADGTVYNSVPENNTAYIQNSLSRWLRKWEYEAKRKLLPVAQSTSADFFFRFDVRELVAGDPNTNADYTGKLRTQGIINGDEAREMHGLNPAGLTDYDNPNTTPGGESSDDEPADETAEAETEEEIEDNTDDAQNRIERRLQIIVNAECNRLEKAACYDGPDADFDAWVERFYGGWAAKLAEVTTEVGGNHRHATNHVAQSRAAIDIIRNRNPYSTTQQALELKDLANYWRKTRAHELANQICSSLT